MSKHKQPQGSGAAGDYDDERGDQRYVGGNRKGGQNLANSGYGANQSFSAGPGYSAGEAHAEPGKPGSAAEPAATQAAVSPGDLGVKDYDLQGGYGKPAQPAAKKPD
jgi:hypothetical protein